MLKQLEKIKCILFDMDGTVYVGNKLIDGAKEAIDALRKHGKQVCFVTNNSSYSVSEYLAKLQKLQIDASTDEVFTSGMAAISYLKKHFDGKSVYLLGTPALEHDFLESGIRLDSDCPAVCVLGFDKTITYEKIEKFNHFLAKGAAYIATHPDKTCPAPDVYVPDTGAFIEMFAASCGRYPDIICGKPYKHLSDAVSQKFGFSSDEIAVVGDRLHTDIAFGKAAGNLAILVLTGETDRIMLADSPQKPDIVLESIADFLKGDIDYDLQKCLSLKQV